MPGTVRALLRYPLKSARSEALTSIELTTEGLPGDRMWACIDATDGTVASAKQPRRWGRLLEVAATTDGPDVVLHFGGTSLPAGKPETDAALGAFLGRPLRLSQVLPDQARLHRLLPDEPGMTPDWLADAQPGQDLVTGIAGTRPGSRFLDYGPVHLVTTGALDGLARELGRTTVEAIRFRPNLVVDAARDPEPGAQVQVGDAVLRILMPTPRCIVPSLAHLAAPADAGLLKQLARGHRRELPGLGRAACFGVYAEVVRPGVVSVGDPVR
jgi:uncharacterized protein YcbX